MVAVMGRTRSVYRRVLAVFAGGVLGALARMLLSTWLQTVVGNGWPMDILLMNLTGAFLLACCMTLADASLLIGPTRRLAINVGFIGAYTTFSSFALGDIMLAAKGQWWLSGGYLLLSIPGGMVAIVLGDLVGQWWINGVRQRRVPQPTHKLTGTLVALPVDETQEWPR